MYESLILRSVARIMLPLLLMLSLFMLMRGHNLPGGGFIGGLLASSAIILQIVAFNPDYARRVLPVNYITLAAVGALFAGAWGLPALLIGEPFLKGFWLEYEIPGIGKIGTPLLFDIGVYLTVIGVTTQVALMLADEPELYPMQGRMSEETGVQQQGGTR